MACSASRMTGGIADGAIMEGCGNVEEVKAFRAVLAEGARRKGRDPFVGQGPWRASNACVCRLTARKARDGAAARAWRACWRRGG